jgi:hypothetical protein
MIADGSKPGLEDKKWNIVFVAARSSQKVG